MREYKQQIQRKRFEEITTDKNNYSLFQRMIAKLGLYLLSISQKLEEGNV